MAPLYKCVCFRPNFALKINAKLHKWCRKIMVDGNNGLTGLELMGVLRYLETVVMMTNHLAFCQGEWSPALIHDHV